jgi:hypothetical protein
MEIEELKSRLAISIAHEFTPQFEYSADLLLESDGLPEKTGEEAGLSFGSGEFPPEIISLVRAYLPLIQFLAGVGIGGFLPTILSGRTASQRHAEISAKLRCLEENQADLHDIIERLSKAYQDVSGRGQLEEVRDMVARALERLEEIQINSGEVEEG